MFLGEAIIDARPPVEGDPAVGGLSSIAYVGDDHYYAITDDRGAHGPARHYVLEIDLDADSLRSDQVTVVEWRPLTDGDGNALVAGDYDLEALVTFDHTLFVTSEGNTAENIEPFVGVFGPDGQLMETLGLPPGFAPEPGIGVRNNLAFESLAITPDGRYLFTGTESALLQDGPTATVDAGTTARLLRFDRRHGVFDAQFAYPIGPVHGTAAPGAGGHTPPMNGLTEMLALSGTHLLALERGFVAGAPQPQSVKLFEVCLEGATDISSIQSLSSTDVAYTPAMKRRLVDLVDLVPRLDNVEGMTFGPPLSDGRQTLIFVSDDNFTPQRQVTQILAFAVSESAIRGCSEQ